MIEKLIELLKLSDACLCDLCGEDGAKDRVAERKWRTKWKCDVTHWMPLPEPPKGE